MTPEAKPTLNLLLLTADPVVRRGATKAASAAGFSVVDATDRLDVPPAAIVLDLEQPGAIDRVSELRGDHVDALLVGHLSMPDPERWVQAERAGCDLVANRGALGRQLADCLGSRSARRRRFPLMAESDIAGRLGFVRRVEETPCGPLAIHHIDGKLSAIDDACPHAGERLSGGLVEGCIVTCPRHGSQFDVQTGERLRGPSDEAVRTHRIAREGTRVHLLWD